MALRTQPSPICAGRCPNRRPGGSAPTSCSNSASPSRTRQTRRRRLISRPHSTSRRPRPLRSRSLSRWDACCRSSGRNRESLEVFDRTRARLGATDRSAALTLEGAALGAAQFDAETADDAAQRIARLRRLAEEEPDVPPSVFGMLAVAAVNANEPADVVARLALRALDGAPKLLPEAVDRPPFFYHACNALAFAERYEEALPRFGEALADARRLGSLPHVLGLSLLPRPASPAHRQPRRRRGRRTRGARDRTPPARPARRRRPRRPARDARRARGIPGRRGGRANATVSPSSSRRRCRQDG